MMERRTAVYAGQLSGRPGQMSFPHRVDSAVTDAPPDGVTVRR